MATLSTIMHLAGEDLKRQIPLEEAVRLALQSLTAREAEVLTHRHGLDGKATMTLQEIGADFGVSRERVRQIESQGLKKFQTSLATEPLASFSKLLVGTTREHGGVIPQSTMLEQFLPESQRTARSQTCLAFLLCQISGVQSEPGDRNLHPFYALSAAHSKAVVQVAPIVAKLLEAKGAAESPSVLLEKVQQHPDAAGTTYLLSESFIEGVLAVSKLFVPTADDQWGLASWSDINPRNIREKTLFILKQHGTPMHYKDITAHIAEARFDAKKVTVQAVHNELINGDGFVLIGRGIYALKEWGYLAGTVSDVIRSVLQEVGGALDREEIIRRVLKQRHVSRNTILINLQEKASFTRVDKHAYTLAG